MNESDPALYEEFLPEYDTVPLFRHTTAFVVGYSLFYLIVFVVGLLGNIFVVLAVALHASLRTTTDWLISSLATADLMIMLLCLPSTLSNNLFSEWFLGRAICKVSVWAATTTSCASIYTLVAVTADRYMAICHTMKYTQWDSNYTLYIIGSIWIFAGSLASPTLFIYDAVELLFTQSDSSVMKVTICSGQSEGEKWLFLAVNLATCFIAPFIMISVFYTLIFITVSNHRSLAVDARIRDERVKLRVAHMMLTVIVVFALCWAPLYWLFSYFYFFADRDSPFFLFAGSVLKPLLQGLSLLNSCLNPLIYIAYSQKYRRAFHRLLLMPCQSRYERVRSITRSTLRLGESSTSNSKKNSALLAAGKCLDGRSSCSPTYSPSLPERSRVETEYTHIITSC